MTPAPQTQTQGFPPGSWRRKGPIAGRRVLKIWGVLGLGV